MLYARRAVFVVQLVAESGDVLQRAQMQQMVVDKLEERHARYFASGRPSSDPARPSFRRQNLTQSGGPDRIDSIRALINRLRDDGVCAHGMLADLLLLRRRRDEKAVTSVLGSALRNTIVVQTRADGARCVASVREAHIRGQVRCDVLNEIKVTSNKAPGGTGELYSGRRNNGITHFRLMILT